MSILKVYKDGGILLFYLTLVGVLNYVRNIRVFNLKKMLVGSRIVLGNWCDEQWKKKLSVFCQCPHFQQVSRAARKGP